MSSARLAWITGASSGLGRQLALDLARRGWTVVVSARTEKSLLEVSGQHLGTRAIACDVTDQAAVEKTVAEIEAAMGPIDLAVLNAGTHIPMGAADFSADTVRHLMDVNVMGTAHCLQAVLPRMRRRRAGTVAVVASVAGYRGLPTAAAYGSTKAALINMAEALAPELAADGVRLRLVNPGFVRTPLTDRNTFPMPFLMEVEDASRRLADALERPAGGFEITFPRRFTWLLKVVRCLPYALYFRLVNRTTRG